MKKRKWVAAIVVLFLFCSAITSYAAETEKTGQIRIDLTLTESEYHLFKDSLAYAKRSGDDYTKQEIAKATDPDKKKYLTDILEQSLKVNTDDYFVLQDDGMYVWSIPYRNADIQFAETKCRADENGYFKTDQMPDTAQELTISRETVPVVTSSAKIEQKKLNKYDIVLVKTLEDLGRGIERMGEGMMEAEGQAVTQKFYGKIAVGQYFGLGKGRSMVYKDYNIVGCNKHDESCQEEISTWQFATQNSDCSQSVKLGLCYLANPTLNSMFYYSYYCVDEAMGAEDKNKDNIYCNGQPYMRGGRTYKNGHTNCSWFYGIGHSEEAHTHQYS